MASAVKKCTGLTGLAVDPNARRMLIRLYDKILRVVQKLPEDYSYRQTTEQLIKERAKIVNNTNSIEEIENQIKCGQAEEMITHAQAELSLARNMLDWKPWEGTAQKNPSQWQWPPVP